MQVISRSEAKAAGLNRYFTGKACKHGHSTERFTNDGKCRECSRIDPAREKSREKEKIANKEKRKIAKLSRPPKNIKTKEQLSIEAVIRAKAWKLKNKDRANELSRIGRARNIDKSKASKKKWSIKNVEKINFLTAKRRANKKLATPKWANMKKVLFIYEQKPKGFCVDHIVPLQSDIVCGLHNEFNLQYLTRSENSQKSNIYWPDMP